MSKLRALKYAVVLVSVVSAFLILYQVHTFEKILSRSSSQQDALSLNHFQSVVEERNFQFFDEKDFNPRKSETRLECEIIHISIVCVGSESSRQVVTLIKSLLFYRKNSLHVHFIVNDLSRLILSHLFRTWDIPDFTVSFYLIDNYLEKVSWIPNTHYSGVYGLLKMTLIDILPKDITKVIALDTDLVFSENVAELWKKFAEFKDSEALGLVENQSDWYLGTIWESYTHWPALGRGFNTGVMLLKCDKLRLLNWGLKWKEVARKYLATLSSTVLADQDIINSVMKEYPFMVHTLPCYWNLQLSEHMRTELCYAKHHNEVKVMHWNTKEKHTLLYDHIKSIRYLYQTFVELNGELVRTKSTICNDIDDYENYMEDNTDDDDLCREFTVSSSMLHRTHLYYLPFEYEPRKETDVTIVVQLSVDRFPMLEKLCKYWTGPVSAAIFSTDSDAHRLVNFVKTSDVLSERKNIAYHFVFKNSNEEIYPINILRNVALHHVITEYVFLYDVDFVPMPGLYQYILTHLTLAHEDKTAFIIPAFESLWYKFEMPLTKSELLKDLENGAITTFRSYMWPKGHAATNYTAWKVASEPYNVKWAVHFEPYVVVKKKECPSYDKRFTGFGWNKISHIMELDAAGFAFTVLPFGFIIHLPHSPSLDLLKFRTTAAYRECLETAKLGFVKYLTIKYGTDMSKYKDLFS